MKNRKKLITIISVCSVFTLLIVSAAAIILSQPEKESGNYERTIINRVDFRIESTNFTFSKTEDEQLFNLTISVSAKKTEADFYALINSISVSGLEYESCVITPCEGHSLTPSLPDAVLGIDSKGNAAECMWKVNLTFKANKGFSAKPVLQVAYTSGVKQEVAQSYILNTDISIQVN